MNELKTKEKKEINMNTACAVRITNTHIYMATLKSMMVVAVVSVV